MRASGFKNETKFFEKSGESLERSLRGRQNEAYGPERNRKTMLQDYQRAVILRIVFRL